MSARELAEYVYCPRAHWYSRHRPDVPVAPSVRRSLDDGLEYHAEYLGGVAARAEHPGRAWAWLVLGISLVALAALLVVR
ncbi:MAG TPA: hypothetical protein VGV89_02880 [Thermoplasmata archaeon]|nr:hypothetical protein [Thermoplasmata archaeon]